ncbi:MAG: pirin family protein [Flavobacteriia bacterium]|nr:pirin family protein [Flavobacteriia bacterium]
MKTKTVELIISPPSPHFVGDGFRVHNFIPSVSPLVMERMNPFILMDYNSKFVFPPSDTPRGVGVHPHRGFETVTLAYKGKVQHHDNSGSGGVIHEGDVQWMTAAGGILHKEYHEKEWSKVGGEFQMVQLWVNLPSLYKMSKPKYQAVKNEDIERFKIDERGSYLEIIAGEYQNIKGKISTFSPINLFNAKLLKESTIDFKFPSNYNTALLVLEGSIVVNESENVPLNHFVLMANDGEFFTVKANENAVVLILSGEPINEPIFAQGPFVMNSRQELWQAFEDFNNGKFGYLED